MPFIIYSSPSPLFTLFWDAELYKPYQQLLIFSWFQPIEKFWQSIWRMESKIRVFLFQNSPFEISSCLQFCCTEGHCFLGNRRAYRYFSVLYSLHSFILLNMSLIIVQLFSESQVNGTIQFELAEDKHIFVCLRIFV